MGPIRSPLGAIGVILVALEAVFGGTLLALDAAPALQTIMVLTMVTVFALVTLVVLWMVVYLTLKKPGFLFNPAEVAQLSESVQQVIYTPPRGRVSLRDEPSDSPSADSEMDSTSDDATPPSR